MSAKRDPQKMLQSDKVLDKLMLDMANAMDTVTERIGGGLCPRCGSTISDSGFCDDVGNHGCMYSD